MTAIAVGAVLVAAWRIMAGTLVRKRDREVARDPDSGLMCGTEPRDLGPKTSRGAVLMVHGFMGATSDFSDMPDAIAARGWRVRVIRQPGHGTSPRDLERSGADEFLDTVRTAYEDLARTHETVVLLGHSMGGMLCCLAAAEQNPDALVLAAPYFSVTYRKRYGMSVTAWARLLGPAVRWVYKGNFFQQLNRREVRKRIVSYHWLPMKSVRVLQKLAEQARRPDVLERIHCPVLLIYSTGDKSASPAASKDAFARLGSSRRTFVELSRANHNVFLDYEHERVYEAILQFLGTPEEPGFV